MSYTIHDFLEDMDEWEDEDDDDLGNEPEPDLDVIEAKLAEVNAAIAELDAHLDDRDID